jgi:hypothetical protein
MADAVFLPRDVAAERLGVDVEAIRDMVVVQELVRRFPDGSEEVAFRIPNIVLEHPEHFRSSWPSLSD